MYFQNFSPINKALDVISFPIHEIYHRKVMFVLDSGLKLIFSPQHFYRLWALYYFIIPNIKCLSFSNNDLIFP